MDDQQASAIAALRAGAAYGPYFMAYTDPDGEEWIPLAASCAPGVLTGEVARTASALGMPEPGRVAASTWHLGLVAHITSPLLGAALHGGVPQVAADRVWTRAGGGGPCEIAMRPAGLLDSGGAALSDVIASVLDGVCTVIGKHCALSDTVLWGNVAASLTGAARVIAAVRPADGSAAADLVHAALQHGRLRGTVDDRGFRRSCCLFYRAPGGGYCGDCVLATR